MGLVGADVLGGLEVEGGLLGLGVFLLGEGGVVVADLTKEGVFVLLEVEVLGWG